MAHASVDNMKTKQSNKSDLRLPNFSLCHPPQIAPVQLPAIMMLAKSRKSWKKISYMIDIYQTRILVLCRYQIQLLDLPIEVA